MATANASAASAASRMSRRSSCLTMCCTCVFSAPPTPTTASLMARGAYSCTPSATGMAASAAPRACPSLSALSAFFARNTRSTAISCGECSTMSSATRAWIRRSRSARGPPEVAMQPWATMRRLPASQSMMPKPVRRLPGSRPRMRAEPFEDTRTTIGPSGVGVCAAGRYPRQDDLIGYRAKSLRPLEKTARIIAAILQRLTPEARSLSYVHNLHSCSPEIKASIDAHAATVAGWGVPPAAVAGAVEAAVIVASLTEDSLLASALLAQVAFAAQSPNRKEDAREIELHFGPEVSALARELQHFGDIRLTPVAAATHHLEPAQAEALRKMLLSVVSDPRLVLARLARQLVELTASKDGHAATRERLALETREVFAPLANRLGLWQLKWELEDLAFRFLQPDDYRRIASALAEKRVDRERYIAELCRNLESMLHAAGVDGEVYGRPKHIYSIHRKMERKQLTFEQVFDLRAVRIVTDSVADCYAALGLVHGRFTYIPGEFDDYIATPKDNFYRSIHTAVLGPEGKAVEVQIRTREMHDQAELGLAAHWRYKESRAHDVSYDRKIEWVRKLLDTERRDADGQRDFLDEVRAELFEDRVYAL